MSNYDEIRAERDFYRRYAQRLVALVGVMEDRPGERMRLLAEASDITAAYYRERLAGFNSAASR